MNPDERFLEDLIAALTTRDRIYLVRRLLDSLFDEVAPMPAEQPEQVDPDLPRT